MFRSLLARSATLWLAIGAVGCSRQHGPSHEHATIAAEPAHVEGGQHSTAPMPTGHAAVQLEPARSGAAAVTTATVEHRRFDKTVRTVGVVTLDETRTAHVHAKVRGFIETVHADFVGKPIKAGAPLCGIYSQAVYAAELEYVALLEQRPTPASDPVTAGTMKKTWDVMLDAGRRRLRLWDVPSGTIAQIERTREPVRTFTLIAPKSGIIVAKQAFVGNYVEPGTELYVISDLSKLWVLVDLYEADLPYVHVGDDARLTIEGIAEPVAAKVAFLAPTIDEATRTLKARLELDNHGDALRPGAFATAELELAMGQGLAVPENAVIHTGPRDIVFVVHGQHVMPREVKLGPLAGGFYRVDSGLREGDAVATSAQFLLDSESQLQATNTDEGGPHAGRSGHTGH